MSEALWSYQLFISGMAVVFFSVTHLVTMRIYQYYRKQNVVRMPLMDERMSNKNYPLLVYQFLFLLLVLSIAWVFGGRWFEFFAGGYLVLLLISLFLVLQNLFYMKGLCAPEAADGMVTFSKIFSCRFTSLWLFASGIMVFCFFLLLGDMLFLGGCFYIFASSLGFLRQARQMTRAQPLPQKK